MRELKQYISAVYMAIERSLLFIQKGSYSKADLATRFNTGISLIY